MKDKKGLVTAFLLLTLAISATAQPEAATPAASKWQITDYYLQYGYGIRSYSDARQADFQKLNPNSSILKRDLSEYNRSFGHYSGAQPSLSIMLGISLREADGETHKTSHHLRAGLTYKSGGGITSSYFRTDTKPYDVLTSPTTGNTIYLDSVKNQYLHMGYNTEQLRLDGSYLVRTNPEGRWSFFTGIGATAGFSLNSYTEVSYFNSHYTQSHDNSNGTYSYFYGNYGSNEYQYEHVRNKTAQAYSMYVPVGLDFRIARYRGLLSRTHLYAEVRPELDMLVIPELGNYTKGNFTSSLGLRVNL